MLSINKSTDERNNSKTYELKSSKTQKLTNSQTHHLKKQTVTFVTALFRGTMFAEQYDRGAPLGQPLFIA